MLSKADIHLNANSLAVSGELNFTTVVTLWQQSLAMMRSLPELDFDLSQVTQSNSGGVALILEWVKYAKLQHKTIRFSHIPPQLQAILSASGLSTIMYALIKNH